MGVTAEKIFSQGLIDGVIEEPLGGAHRDVEGMCSRLRALLSSELRTLQSTPMDVLLANRYKKYMAMGV